MPPPPIQQIGSDAKHHDTRDEKTDKILVWNAHGLAQGNLY